MFRFSKVPFGAMLVTLLILGGLACEGTPDRSMSIYAYAPVNQLGEGKSVMESVTRIRLGVFEAVGGDYQSLATYRFDNIVREYTSCSSTYTRDVGWSETSCVNCLRGDCSDTKDTPDELKTRIEACKRVYAEQISANVLGYADCTESKIIDKTRIDSLELPDLPAGSRRPYTYVVEGFGDPRIESTDCCGNCDGNETACNEGWSCRLNPDNLNVCYRNMTNSVTARGISAPTAYAGTEQTHTDIMFARLMDFATVTTPDGDAATMESARAEHAALALPDGKVLILGGESEGQTRETYTYPRTGELFDPQTNTFESIEIGGWSGGRSRFALVDLGLSGGSAGLDDEDAPQAVSKRFFIAGGMTSQGATGEMYVGSYNTEDGSLSLSRLNQAITPVSEHTATLLLDGNILIVGGKTASGATAEAFLVNPTTGTVTPTDTSLARARYGHTATLMPNGNVIVVGGLGTNEQTFTSEIVEVYNPENNIFTRYEYDRETEQDHSIYASRAGHIAVPLVRYQPDGSVTADDMENAAVAIWGGYRYTAEDAGKNQRYYYNMPAATEAVVIAFVNSNGRVEQTPWTPNPGYRIAMTRAKVPSPHPCVGSRWVWLGESRDTILLVGGRRNNMSEYSDWAEILRFVGGQGGYTLGSFRFGPDEADTINTPFRIARFATNGRGAHSLTQLANGTYLVVGGRTFRTSGTAGVEQTLVGAELFVPPSYNRYGNVFQVIPTFK